MSLLNRARLAAVHLRRLKADAHRLAEAHRGGGSSHPRTAAVFDSSLWALTLLRTSAFLRSVTGTSFGLPLALRLGFQIDVWSDDVGGGLRLPHPFCIVIGEGVQIGSQCTILHGVTIQRGDTVIEPGVALANGVTVLAGSSIGTQSLVGAGSVVRGVIPDATVAVGSPARPIRAVRPTEARSPVSPVSE